AGAVPGPACYGRGGERPTVTDACLALRWLDAQHPLADAVRLDRDAAEHALRSLGVASDPSAIPAGLVAVGAAGRARALKRGRGALLRYAECRFAGQGYEVTVPVTGDDPQRIRDAFLIEHRARFGHAGTDQAVEIVNLRVVALREGPLPRLADVRRVVQRPGA